MHLVWLICFRYVDGTFKLVKEPFPKYLASMPLSDLVSGMSLKQIPLAFVTMTNRGRTDYVYEAVFRALHELIRTPPAVEQMEMDYEGAT